MLKNSSIKILTIATRKSPLALWQANFVAEKIKFFYPHIEVKLLPLVTTGDLYTDNIKVKGKGLFLKELEAAILTNKAQLAVHSMKDIPATLPLDLEITAICKRDNPLDVFISNKYKDINSLPPKAVIGTSSVRRQAQLLAWRKDLCFKPIRGNVQTRLQKLKDENLDGIILAAAGIERLNLDRDFQELAPTLIVPACGQGAIGIECRKNDLALQELLKPLHDELATLCVKAERRVNLFLNGNCSVPIGIFCRPTARAKFLFTCKISSLDNHFSIHFEKEGIDPNSLAQDCISFLKDHD